MMLRLKVLVLLAGCSIASPSLGADCPNPFPNWATATATPERVPQMMNTIRLEGDRLVWNGQKVSEASAREYLGLIANRMNPQPLTILTYSARTSCKSVRRARLLIDEVLQCKAGECLEVADTTE